MLKFVLCDDNEIILERLSKILESLFIKHNLDAEISFTSLLKRVLLRWKTILICMAVLGLLGGILNIHAAAFLRCVA